MKILRNLLYYPTINIPSDSWMRNALLYWDEISSIVPQSWDGKYLNKLSSDVNFLIGEEQFRPISPDNLITNPINQSYLDDFEEEFKSIIRSEQVQKIISKSPHVISEVHGDKVGIDKNKSSIHFNKTSSNLFTFLEEQGLASKTDGEEWVLFENHTALIYMSLLAKHLADIDINQTTISTDRKIYERFNFRNPGLASGIPTVDFQIFNFLPTPTPNVPFKDILHFKNKRKDELLNFRTVLFDFQTKLSNASSVNELKHSAAKFEETMSFSMKNLMITLKESKVETINKTIKSSLAFKSPTLWSVGGAALVEHFGNIHIPAPIKLIGLASVGMFELRTNFIELRNKNRAEGRKSPFSYLLSAQRDGIIQPLLSSLA